MAILAGDFPGREVDARVAAWTWLAADLWLGIVVLDGLDDKEIELVVQYVEWLAQRLPDQECACNGVRGKPKVLERYRVQDTEIPGAKTEILGANNGCGCKDTGCKACVDDYKRRGDVT
jgi:hypothetical protein